MTRGRRLDPINGFRARNLLAPINMPWSRRNLLILAGCAALALVVAASTNQRDFIIYNHSPSVPPGFYVRTGAPVSVGAFVTVRARDVAPDEAHSRQFEDASDRFIKRVAATNGQSVCGDGASILIDGVEAMAIYQSEDRPAPSGWVGCRTLRADEVLLLGDTADSFDGRYWGPVSVSLIEGVWRKL